VKRPRETNINGISEFTRDICRRLCVERGIEMEIARLDTKLAAMEMEIARLDTKLAAMEKPGCLTPIETQRDTERASDAKRMFDAAESP
jgi:hypothetical protein